MSDTKMMKVDVSVAERLENMKTTMFGGRGSLSDVVEKLIQYFDKQPRHVELPEETMTEVKKCKDYLKVSSEADVIKITQHNFDISLNMPITVFEMIQDHQKRRW